MMSTSGLAARLRGVAAGLLTATLAIAAHGAGGGALPAGAVTVALTVLAATVGVLTASLRRAAEVPVLLGMLAAGQVLGHVLLGIAGHTHAPTTTTPAAVMLAAHLVAIVLGAALITTGERLCRAVSRILRVAQRVIPGPIASLLSCNIIRDQQPLHSALALAASVSHRGPPISLAR